MTRVVTSLALAVAALMAAAGPASAVLGMRLYYDERHRGYVAVPEDPAPAPGILLVHDWSGLDGGELVAARRWAEAGYAVMAVDLFDGETFESRAASRPLTRALLSRGSERSIIRNLQSGLSYLKEMEGVDPTRIAIVGYDFGGAMSILAATEAFGLQAAVAYETPIAGYEVKGPVAPPILLLTAAPPPAEAEALLSSAAEDERSAVASYPNVKPGFAIGNSAEATAAFDRGVDFLDDILAFGAR